MLVGPKSTAAEVEDFRHKVLANPGNSIARPTLALSATPTFVDQGIARVTSTCGPIVWSAKASNWFRAG